MWHREREKDNFKSREVNCLKECALALNHAVYKLRLVHDINHDNGSCFCHSTE